MPVELKVPSVGESITEVEIGEWLKPEGASARKDENVVVIESEKATVEIPAPVGGKVTKVLKKKGDKARVGEVIGYMEEGEVADTKPVAKPVAEPTAPATPRVMPAAARAAAEAKVDVQTVKPTGPGGRILKEDVMAAVPASKPVAASPAIQVAGRAEEVVPMTVLRRKIAERLVQAQQTTASLTTFNEVDMAPVMALRQQYQESFTAKYGIKLGFMSFFVKAVIDAAKQIPQLNAEIRGTDIVYRNYYDIGIAVGGGKGLVVPVIRNAERLSFAEVEKVIADFGARAKENKLKPDELVGGTFTISNLGSIGGTYSTPIINPPQVAILLVGRTRRLPQVLDGDVVVPRLMMPLSITYDHRLVDGAAAARFLNEVKGFLAAPGRLLLAP